jgi:hypothetical protein
MTTPRDPDLLIHAFLREGAEQLQDQVYDVVRAEIDQKRQRVVIGPWRVSTVSKLVPIGLGAAAVIAVLFLGSRFIGSPSSNVGGPPSQPPASAPSEAPISGPALTESFTSPLHGISLSYPAGWTADPATEPWMDSPNSHPFNDPQADHLHLHPTMIDVFLTIASQPIGDATPEDWIAEQMAEWADIEGCTTTEAIDVDGATGLIGSEGCDLAVVTTDGRGYWISLRVSDRDTSPYGSVYDRAWFEEVLATVQLQPANAVDAPVSAPPLTQSFTSPLQGISMSYPEGWAPQAATEPWTDSTFPFIYTSPQVDFLHDPPGFNLNLVFGSQPIGDSAPEDWVARQMASEEGCPATATEPITVDGASGLIGSGDCDVVAVTTDGRGYVILAGISDDVPSIAALYDRAWFEEVLATVQLHPEDAVDAAP